MLPSTGYFKGITCPFFESGLCERPYCHFRHVKRDLDINCDPIDNADILKQLVSEAVKKVLLQSEGSSSDIEIKSQSIISQVVQELKPPNIKSDKPSMKATYNPTPIAELNKMAPVILDKDVKPPSRDENRKHIPVPYTPHRPSRTQLSRAPVKLDSGATLSLTVQEACATNTTDVNQDKYTPSAIESESSVKYLPGSAGDNPVPYSPGGQTNISKGGISYVPSNLSAGNDAVKVCGYSPVGQSTSGVSYKPGAVRATSSNSYCPTNNSTLNQTDKKSFSYTSKFNYKPTPLTKVPSPTFSSDEDDEPSAKKPKLNESEGLDDLDVEFEMLGEILDDENNSVKKSVDTSTNNTNKTISSNDNAAKAVNKQSDQENKVTEDSFDTFLAASNVVNNSSTADLQVEKSSVKHNEKTTSRKDQSKPPSSISSNKLVPSNSTSKHVSNFGRESKSSRSDRKHSTKKKEEDVLKERDKDSSSKEKDRSSKDKDQSKKASIETDKKSSHDHKKNDKFKSSTSHRDSKIKDSSRKSTDEDRKSSSTHQDSKSKSKSTDHDNKSKSKSTDHDNKSKSKSTDHDNKSKSKSTDHDNKSKSSSSSNRNDSKSVKSSEKPEKPSSSSKDKYKDKAHKSSHSSSSRHSSKDKSVSKESSSSKRSSSHSKDKTEPRESHSKSKHIKEVDLFSVSDKSDIMDKMSDADSIGSDVIEIFSESDEETITQECLKIFEEYVPTMKENPSTETSKQTSDEDAQLMLGKKRMAHTTNTTIYRTPTTVLPNHKSKAIQMVADRYAKVKQFHNERSTSSECSPSPSVMRDEPSVSHVASGSKVRIAHVPYASTLINAKKTLKVPEPPKSTPVQTVTKGSNRVAHMPNDKFSDRPTPLEPLASKVPINIRCKYLNMMIDDCLKIYLTAEDAYQRALQEELSTNKKCTTMPIYKNSALLTISRLRKEIKEAGGAKITNGSNTISHSKVMLGKKGETVSWSIENKYKKDNSDIANELKGNKFYQNIYKWILSEEELRENGFPRPHPDKKEKGCAKIYTQNTKQKPPRGSTRCCNRCKKEYVVDKKGFAIRKEECIYHPKNKYRFRGEVKYQCCSQDASSDGCLSASCHVFEYVDYDNLRGYVTTLPKEKESLNHAVYALDCEMSYTTNGLDLTRVTVINSSLNVVYETLVKPLYPIIDYNTNFSGITEEQMKGVTTTLLEVQATLLHMFSDKTILVGHSLESDFKALKLIHSTIIDTSVLFPHKMGPPYKRALRNLSSEYLKKIIQNSVDGHDSAEDALVCMELLIWKVKEEFKTK